ncbi:hypothetical protein RND81_04G014000 [Saponaria officinalis]|uniref:rRNA N-glycosylase n=1 Tax=Saponaria officinalis TaxID=3572 RepID=A0AAW1LGJ2_SAPOF
MKSWLVVVITWVILQSSAWAVTFTLDLTSVTETEYSTFLTNIRNNVRDATLVYGGTNIPVVGNNPATTFLRVDLIVSTGTVSLGIRRSDLYVVAYLANNDRNVRRVYYFSGLITSAQLDTLFPEARGAANQQIIKEYEENYASLEKAAKVNRKQAGLGIDKLVKYIAGVNGVARAVPSEAKFILVAVQMVSEATRFGYIQNQVLENFPTAFTPDDKVIILERNWDRISEAIKGSNKGVFPAPVVLKCDGITTTWTVNNATELNMGILKYLGRALLRLVKIDVGNVSVLLVLSLILLIYVGFTLFKSHMVKKATKNH